MLSVIEGSRQAPFEIKRLFYVYCVHPGDVYRTIQVTIDDGYAVKTFVLDRPDRGLVVPPTLWAEQRYELAET